ncbi:DUF421 domain-containing protein [Clostridium sp. D2Q-11]|uniref:DUF421 domain-containing protein n=2 Tax=Anaeromonas frigoriresistens TaxID=2683708 RepID=A0A942UTP9_9FIRM|nr:DUF421 domain-containing protein [Anaeromonas frigoriresistens]MBS4538393.1 DUF421 domain-containing protein [Anaeromonas frigoriresistens]
MTLLLFSTLFIMGKRPIGELPVFDFLSLIVIGAIVGADIADPNIEHLPTAFAVIILAALQRFVSEMIIKNKKFKKWVTFEPTIIIQDGQLIHKNIKKIKYSIDEVLMLLREKDIFDINTIEYGVIESSGKLSILKRTEYDEVIKRDMNIVTKKASLPVAVVVEKELQTENIKRLNLNPEDILKILNKQGYSRVEDVFFAAMDSEGNISISPYQMESDVLEP